jgi:acyl carrier protein phosphodiesterase
LNYLCHLYLSGDEPEILVGNFMGDFVKGRVGDNYPLLLRQGIVLHRRIDSFTHNHPLYRRSKQRISPLYGLYRGVLVDLFYDHLLAAEWSYWSEETMTSYLKRVRLIVEEKLHCMPERLQGFVPMIFEELIPSYREVEGIGRALERMSRRLKRPNPLAGGEKELERNYVGLREDFRSFMPSIREYVADFLKSEGLTDRRE